MGGWVPDTGDFGRWVLQQLGTPEFVVLAIGTVLAILSWWAVAKFVHGFASDVGDRLAGAASPSPGQRAAGVATLTIAAVAFPVVILLLLKIVESYTRFPAASPMAPTFDLPLYVRAFQDWSTDDWLARVAATVAAVVVVYLLADLGRLGIASFLQVVLGYPLAGAFWLIGALSAGMAVGYPLLTYAHVDGASLGSVPVHLATLALAILGWWSLMRLASGWSALLPVGRNGRSARSAR